MYTVPNEDQGIKYSGALPGKKQRANFNWCTIHYQTCQCAFDVVSTEPNG